METIALSYLRGLWNAGYFAKTHTSNSYTWLPEEPACQSGNDYFYAAIYWLRDNGYILQQPSTEEFDRLKVNLHPKDWLDLWWLELTPKGRDYLQD